MFYNVFRQYEWPQVLFMNFSIFTKNLKNIIFQRVNTIFKKKQTFIQKKKIFDSQILSGGPLELQQSEDLSPGLDEAGPTPKLQSTEARRRG